MSVVDKAREIAKLSLRACYRENGIVAGNHHFTDFWARDGFFASMGAIEIGDKKIVEEMVALFFRFQRSDGLIPYRVMNGPINIKKYLGKPSYYKTPQPTYRLRNIGSEVLDGTILTIMLAAKLDLKKYKSETEAGLKYLKSKEKNGLLWDGPMAEWNDAVWKWGNLLYTNILYWKMFKELKNEIRAKEVEVGLRNVLWNGEFFADWSDYKRQDYFYSFGNCLAVIWGLTTKEESVGILNLCKKNSTNFSIETNNPKYPWWRVDLGHVIMGMGDYHNHGVLWWQPICAYILALRAAGQNEDAEENIVTLCQKIVNDKQVFECYERDGAPIKRMTYHAEYPFAWAAGMILEVLCGYNIQNV